MSVEFLEWATAVLVAVFVGFLWGRRYQHARFEALATVFRKGAEVEASSEPMSDKETERLSRWANRWCPHGGASKNVRPERRYETCECGADSWAAVTWFLYETGFERARMVGGIFVCRKCGHAVEREIEGLQR